LPRIYTPEAKAEDMQAIVRRLRRIDREKRLAIVIGLAVVACSWLCLHAKIPLSVGYHEFADQRTLLGIPRAFDVLSNAIFLVIGLWGLKFLLGPGSRSSFLRAWERLPYMIFFGGVALTGIGSAYYHLAPSDSRLPWDLLPMTLAFMSLLAATIAERISVRSGLVLLPVLVFLGIASVEVWQSGELQGAGDYRFYLFTQYFPQVAIAAMIALFPPRYTHTRDLFIGFAFYALAKLLEFSDHHIFGLGQIVSGHSLKHLSAGVACGWILRMVILRRAARLPDAATMQSEYVTPQGTESEIRW